eukprot:13197856-Alexandrium_andersonii.AAC.1
MSASLVGSEMCIRDRCRSGRGVRLWKAGLQISAISEPPRGPFGASCEICLLYTSDAADDM